MFIKNYYGSDYGRIYSRGFLHGGNISQIYLGSGGAGSQYVTDYPSIINDYSSTNPCTGAPGGGNIIIFTNTLNNSPNFKSNGGVGESLSYSWSYAGGGAGGTIFLNINSVTNDFYANANGSNGCKSSTIIYNNHVGTTGGDGWIFINRIF